jgi:hypothetical protein
MVQEYAQIADEVIILISRPIKAGRQLPNGREITAEDSLKIWQLLTAGMPNVSIQISDHASPITATYEYIDEKGPLVPGTTLILGSSVKGNDWKRWLSAQKYVKEGVALLPPQETAVLPATRANGTPFSATDLRNALGDPVNNRAEIAELVGENNVDGVLDILQLQPPSLKEVSVAADAGGYSIPLGSTLVRGPSPKKKKKKKVTRKENIDLSLVEEVLELLIGRGI